jgi:hypothetical protein
LTLYLLYDIILYIEENRKEIYKEKIREEIYKEENRKKERLG